MRLIPPADAARRARAAVAYAGLEIPEITKRTGIASGTIRNILSRTRPSSGTIERLWSIADACDVPRSFMEDGWDAITAPHHASNLEQRMDELSEELHVRMARLEEELQDAGLRRLVAEDEPATGPGGTSSTDAPGPGREDPEQQEQQ